MSTPARRKHLERLKKEKLMRSKKVEERYIDILKNLKEGLREEVEHVKGRSKVKDLEERFNMIDRTFKRYEKNPTLLNLAKLHDATQVFKMVRDTVGVLQNKTFEGLVKSRKFKKVKEFWDKADIDNVYMSKEDAKKLGPLTQREYDEERGTPEFSGGMKAVRKGKKIILKPIYSHTHRMESASPPMMSSFLETKANIIWHTHPFDIGFSDRSYPSRSDILYTTGGAKIPIVTISSKKKGSSEIYITIKGKTKRVKIL